jgi:hypothetical protein
MKLALAMQRPNLAASITDRRARQRQSSLYPPHAGRVAGAGNVQSLALYRRGDSRATNTHSGPTAAARICASAWAQLSSFWEVRAGARQRPFE